MRTSTSNVLFKIVTTCALAATVAAVALGPVAVAIFNVTSAATLLWFLAPRLTRYERWGFVAVESAIATTAWLGWLAYIGFVPNALFVAFMTWFAWCFRMTRLW